MKNRHLSYLFSITVVSISAFGIAHAGYWDTGLQNAGQFGLSDASAEKVIIGFLQWILRIFIALTFIFFVVTGITYLFAGANKGLAENAKTATLYSIIAIAVALGAYVVINLIDYLLLGAG